ncbi:MAG: hypothetical protein ACLFT8_05000, partial [Desulfovermiculus sp.]
AGLAVQDPVTYFCVTGQKKGEQLFASPTRKGRALFWVNSRFIRTLIGQIYTQIFDNDKQNPKTCGLFAWGGQ